MNEPKKIVVLSADLMDRSKISAAYAEATIVRSTEQLVDQAEGAELVIVDLNRVDDVAVLTGLLSRVVAFGSHVDETLLAEAAETGAEALPRSVFFRRIAEGSL